MTKYYAVDDFAVKLAMTQVSRDKPKDTARYKWYDNLDDVRAHIRDLRKPAKPAVYMPFLNIITE